MFRVDYQDTGQHCPRFTRTGSVADGDEIECGAYRWHVLSAPGHDPESIVLHQPEHRLLISADALWENGFGVVFPELEGDQAFDDVRGTLERISNLGVDWVIPGHGPPFRGIGNALARAHSRLDAFIADPPRHSRHAAKVLIKFHLLEVQRQPLPDLYAWLHRTRFMHLSHARHFRTASFAGWCGELLDELAAVRAVEVNAEIAVNI